jgi:putative acetyltransferase
MQIRAEAPDDIASIRAITAAAFENMPFSDQTEPGIIDALRRAGGALSVSLVATEEGEVVGHVVFSPVLINRQAGDWYGLGPVSVRPDRQRRGIGQRSIRRGLEELRSRGAEAFGKA